MDSPKWQRRVLAPWLACLGLNAPGGLLSASETTAEADGLSIDFSHRTRYEALHNQFRPGLGGSDSGVVLRTRLAAEYARGGFRLGGELLDARAYDLAPRSSADGNLVDAFEPLTAYVGWDGAVPGDQTRASAWAPRPHPRGRTAFGSQRLSQYAQRVHRRHGHPNPRRAAP